MTDRYRMTTDVQDRIGEWGDVTFPDSTVYSITEHFLEEVDEVHEAVFVDQEWGDGDLPTEAADCAILLFQLAHRAGFDLIAEVERKFAVNQQRTWGEPDERGVVRHVEVAE